MTRNIGLKVKAPKEEPKEGDKKNPFNGTLPVRGKLFEGKVVKSKAKIQLYSKKKLLSTLVNSRDMEEVPVEFMHTYHQT